MPQHSAGILLYRMRGGGPQVLLVHPGGPYWAKRDLGAWSIPKGEYGQDCEPLAAALREFAEETGHPIAPGTDEVIGLGTVRQGGGKQVVAFAVEGDLDVTALVSNTFRMRWPPRSDALAEFPEVDRAGWFEPDEARVRMNPAQAAFVDRLIDALAAGRRGAG
ncbi:MAG TPA: NUDIX domain-containing protein [Mycobacteriales bacterium]|nr:NUDIX domain-containing protein [Mycobacteriales bacterium]